MRTADGIAVMFGKMDVDVVASNDVPDARGRTFCPSESAFPRPNLVVDRKLRGGAAFRLIPDLRRRRASKMFP